MKKILVNAYTSLNFGDDLFLKILFDRYHNVKWILPRGGRIYKELFREYENVEVKCSLLFRVKNKVGIKEKNSIFTKYDAGIYIGGSIFMEIPKWRKQLLERKRLIKSFSRKNKPYFILGSNFGSYKSDEFMNEYVRLFKYCRDVCFRDKYSYSFFRKYENIRKAPDIVFQLKPRNITKIKNSIGISLIDISNRDELSKYENNYLNKVRDLVLEGNKRGYRFTFFSFCKHEGDLIAINKVVKLIGKECRENFEVVNYEGNIDEFLEKFESMENIIGTRFHSVILSQVFNQGLYPFIYSDKTLNVLRDIGLGQEYYHIRNCEESEGKSDKDKFDVGYILDIISSNKINNKELFIESEKQFQELDKYVRES